MARPTRAEVRNDPTNRAMSCPGPAELVALAANLSASSLTHILDNQRLGSGGSFGGRHLGCASVPLRGLELLQPRALDALVAPHAYSREPKPQRLIAPARTRPAHDTDCGTTTLPTVMGTAHASRAACANATAAKIVAATRRYADRRFLNTSDSWQVLPAFR